MMSQFNVCLRVMSATSLRPLLGARLTGSSWAGCGLAAKELALRLSCHRKPHCRKAVTGSRCLRVGASGEYNMLWRSVLLVSVILSPLGYSSANAAKPAKRVVAAGERGLIGTWRLVRYENKSKDGQITKPYGEQPLGYFTYDPTGHLSIHIMRNPPLPPFASGSKSTATEAEKLRSFDAYVGYFGTYRVDKGKRVLHHLVEGALDTTYTNTDQLRPYSLKGDILIIGGDNPDGSSYYRELHRVR